MIDIHAHILPGIDDGAADMYDTLEMAAIAVESGVTGIVATPHCNIPDMFANFYDDKFIELFLKTENRVKEEGIPLQLYAGMEVFMTEEVPSLLRDGKLLTINGSHNMLVEFSFDEDPDFVQKMLAKVKDLGVCPVIAHAERYYFVQDDIQMVHQWIKNGYLVQVNKGSLLGRFGRHAKKAAYYLLHNGLVSVIASDAHSPFQRTPYMLDAYDELALEYSEESLKILFEENPRRICHDLPILSVREASLRYREGEEIE